MNKAYFCCRQFFGDNKITIYSSIIVIKETFIFIGEGVGVLSGITSRDPRKTSALDWI